MTGFDFINLLDGNDPPCLITNFHTGDIRGGFSKCFERTTFEKNGIQFNLSETFFSTSAKNVIRGMHFQINKPQAKLVTVLSGKVLDIVVDLRPNSGTFKQWISVELCGDNNKSLYIPRGFAHGFASLEDGTLMLYQCDGRYDKDTDTGIRFDDPELGIDWPIPKEKAIHSSRDLALMTFEEYMRAPMVLDTPLEQAK